MFKSHSQDTETIIYKLRFGLFVCLLNHRYVSLFLFLFKENTNCSECTVWVTAHVGPDPLLDGWAGKLMTLRLFCKIRIKTPLYSKIIVNIRIHICKCLCSTWLITKLSLAGRVLTVFTATSQGRIIHYCPLSLGLFMGLALFNDTEVEKMHHLHGEVFSLLSDVMTGNI